MDVFELHPHDYEFLGVNFVLLFAATEAIIRSHMDLHMLGHTLGQNFAFIKTIPLLKGLFKGLERGEAKQIVL